ncbi:MAG: hypothetical protein O2913_11970 [Chloroflexi bacterium]|nr:hypothetical protein [Chloroflexota bacterium]
MQETQEEPLHWDEHRTKLNLTIGFALVVVVISLFGANPFLFIIGVGVAIYSWLTNAKQYLIYRDSLVIIYGRPRTKSYPFQDIAHLETLSLPMGERLRVRFVNGRRIMLMTKDPETFRAKLDEALEAFHGEQRGSDYREETQPERLQGYDQEAQPELAQDYDQEIQQEIETELPEEPRRQGESSGENDNVPY